MAKHVRRHAAEPWWRVAVGGEANVFSQQVRHAVAGERCAAMALEDHVVAVRARMMRRKADAVSGQSGQIRSFFPLPRNRTCRGRSNRRSLGTHSQRFADAGTRIVEEQQQRVITTATRRTGINGGNYGASLFRFKVCDRSMRRPFGPNRQNSAVLSGARNVVTEQMLHETADRRQATVSCHSRVARLDSM